MSGPQVAGEPYAERLMRALDYRLHPTTRRLSPDEVAVVLHALADHSALEAARAYDRMERNWIRASGTGEPPRETLWPTSTSIGRWLHDTADHLARLAVSVERVDGTGTQKNPGETPDDPRIASVPRRA